MGKSLDLEFTLNGMILLGMKKMTIKEVSEKYNLSKDTLRYYEKEGLIGPVLKGSNGQRDYKEENLRQIEFINEERSR